MRKIRKTAALMCILLVVTICGACGGKQNGTGNVKVSDVNQFPIVEEKTTLTVFTAKPGDVEDMETNAFTKWYEEKTNVKIEWVFAAGDARRAINLQIASDDIADVFMGFSFSRSEQAAYYGQGIFIDLTDLVNEHGYYIKKMFEENPDIEKNMRHTEGKLLGLPGAVEDFTRNAPYKMWIYKPWMDKLGADMPETTEEFYELLKRFKNEDPNGNGIADEIPLAGRNLLRNPVGLDTYLMNAFVPWGPYGYYNDNGKAKFAPIQDEAKEGIRWIKKLYDEGLIHADGFIMDRNRITALAENSAPIMGAAPAKWTTQFTIAGSESGRSAEYVAVPPLKGPKGKQATYTVNSYGTSVFSITSDCENPELAIKWADWFYSEEQYLKNRGPVGIRKAKAGELGFDGEQALFAIDKDVAASDITMQNDRWPTGSLVFWPINNYIKTADYSINAEREKNSYDAYNIYSKYAFENVCYEDITVDLEDSADYMELRTNLCSAIDSGFVSFVIGEKDLDKDWDAYVQKFYDLGLERYLEIVQKDIEKTKK